MSRWLKLAEAWEEGLSFFPDAPTKPDKKRERQPLSGFCQAFVRAVRSEGEVKENDTHEVSCVEADRQFSANPEKLPTGMLPRARVNNVLSFEDGKRRSDWQR